MICLLLYLFNILRVYNLVCLCSKSLNFFRKYGINFDHLAKTAHKIAKTEISPNDIDSSTLLLILIVLHRSQIICGCLFQALHFPAANRRRKRVLVFHSCSPFHIRLHSFPFVFSVFHSCSIRVPFVFTCFPFVFHSCSLVFHSYSFVFPSCSQFPIRVPSCVPICVVF